MFTLSCLQSFKKDICENEHFLEQCRYADGLKMLLPAWSIHCTIALCFSLLSYSLKCLIKMGTFNLSYYKVNRERKAVPLHAMVVLGGEEV
jgi:hypothetical protein